MAPGNPPLAQLWQRLRDNISAIEADPDTAIDIKTFEEAKFALPRSTIDAAETGDLVRRLSNLLATLRQDPTPVVDLLRILQSPYSYSDVLLIGIEHEQLANGLAHGDHMAPVNELILDLLFKATTNATDAAHVASMPDVMLALIRLFLCTKDMGIADRSSKLLRSLLAVDQSITTESVQDLPVGGHGLVWKRIFGDRNVYHTFFEACSSQILSALNLSHSQRSLAQVRLMEWLAYVAAMDWTTVSRSHFPEVERAYNVDGGLVQFVSTRMVDIDNDVFTHRSLIEFFTKLLGSVKPSLSPSRGHQPTSPVLIYLIKEGLHARVISMYLGTPSGTGIDPSDTAFLIGPAAMYIAQYAFTFPDHFVTSQLSIQVLDHLMRQFDVSPSRWVHGQISDNDITILRRLPRQILLPNGDGSSDWRSSPLSLIPSKSTSPAALSALASIFGGPKVTLTADEFTIPFDEPRQQLESACARILYHLYLSNNQTLWKDIVAHAETVALPELALAAIDVLKSVIEANWFLSTPPLVLPTSIQTAPQGWQAILISPALESVVPYLVNPSQNHTNIIGVRGDANNQAYNIAVAKYTALQSLHKVLKDNFARSPDPHMQGILTRLELRLKEGVVSSQSRAEPQVATLEL